MEDDNEFKSSDATKLMEMLVAGGALALLSDPGRPWMPSGDLEELARYPVRTVPDLEHPDLQEAVVFRLLSGASE